MDNLNLNPTVLDLFDKPISLDDYLPSDNPSELSSDDEKLLILSLGHRDCSYSISDRIIDLYLLALTATILFVVLSVGPIDKCIKNNCSNYWSEIAVKGFIIFIVIFLLDRLLNNWRKGYIPCTDRG